MRVPLSLACGAYDRTAALARGDIRPEGVDLTFLALPVEETFFRMTRHREFDAAEMSLSSYLISLDQDAPNVCDPGLRLARVSAQRDLRRRGRPGRRPGRAGGRGGGRGRVPAHRQRLLAETAVGASLLPWAYAEAERTRDVMGADFWTYGLAGNEDTLGTFVRYAFEQGLISREREPAELFAPETREAYVI
jgi:hypothetical protein